MQQCVLSVAALLHLIDPIIVYYLETFLAMRRIINNTDCMILSLVLHVAQEVPCVTGLIVFQDKIVIAAT